MADNKDDDKILTFDDMVFLSGGRRVPMDETGKDRLKRKAKVPEFKTKEERRNFYLDYIPALYFVEIEGINPDEINKDMIEMFWSALVTGVKTLGEFDEDGGGDMDG